MIFSKLKSVYSWGRSLFVKNVEVDYNNLPKHIAIIMDGNGRWAKSKGLDRKAGHAAGAETLQDIVEYASSINIKVITVFAFSTENWSRPKAEVDALMDLLYKYLSQTDEKLAGENNVIRIIGDTSQLREDLQEMIVHVQEISKDNKGLILNIALNYGSRDEIIEATKNIARGCLEGNIKVDDINEQMLSNYMYTKGMPDPDLIIRPSGEFRLSNFLLWQAAYSELWFANVNWPDFTKKHLRLAIAEYQKRNRRFGGA